jgi:hypothetical protein
MIPVGISGLLRWRARCFGGASGEAVRIRFEESAGRGCALPHASVASLLRRRGGTPNFSIMKRQNSATVSATGRSIRTIRPVSEQDSITTSPRRVAARKRQTARPRALDDAHPRWPGCGSRLLVLLDAGADRGAVALAAGELEVVVADSMGVNVVGHGFAGEGFSEDDLDHEITVVVHEDHVVCRR